jgi:hypothetical protein
MQPNLINPCTGNLHLGRLLPPKAFLQACGGASPGLLRDAVWSLALHLPDDLVDALESDVVPPVFSLMILESSTGVLYPVFVVQVGEKQLRAMLSLSDGGTANWLKESIERGAIRLTLLGDDVSRLTVIETDCTGHTEHDIDDYASRSAQLDLAGRIADAAAMTRKLFDPEALPRARNRPPPLEVHVVLVSTAGTGPDRAPVKEADAKHPLH